MIIFIRDENIISDALIFTVNNDMNQEPGEFRVTPYSMGTVCFFALCGNISDTRDKSKELKILNELQSGHRVNKNRTKTCQIGNLSQVSTKLTVNPPNAVDFDFFVVYNSILFVKYR